MSQHTPTPWNVVTHNGVSLIDGDADRIGVNVEAPANAAFIVRACNSHDALVKALEALHIEMDAFRQNAEVSDNTKRHWAKACDEARAALALAKEA